MGKFSTWLGTVAESCNATTLETEAKGSGIQDQPGLPETLKVKQQTIHQLAQIA